jgi:hypothetical protein
MIKKMGLLRKISLLTSIVDAFFDEKISAFYIEKPYLIASYQYGEKSRISSAKDDIGKIIPFKENDDKVH